MTTTYIGVDIGTSSVKAVLLREDGHVVASHAVALDIYRPEEKHSEQVPEHWWTACCLAIDGLMKVDAAALQQCRGIGLTGQMHGATLLDQNDTVLRRAILWNDGRSSVQCRELEALIDQSRQITGNIMMPGFTAPKVEWVRQNEKEIFQSIAKVLLPKDYVRLRLTGCYATDMSDASGTMYLDVGVRKWSQEILSQCGLDESHMPRLYEGTDVTGYITQELSTKWGIPATVPVVAGGGDNAAGAIGMGVYQPGQAMLSLGTSGVYFVVTDGFRANPDNAVHSFCHALPNTWHLMSVMLSAASCLDWVANLTNTPSVDVLLANVEADANNSTSTSKSPIWFLPYLSGERTPHNNPDAKGAFWGLTLDHGPVDMARAVMEGVGFALTDGMDAVHSCGGIRPSTITLIGGGARNAYWRQMISDITNETLEYRLGGDVGPALGAAKLAQIHSSNLPLSQLLPPLQLIETHQPNQSRHQHYQQLRHTFKELYKLLTPLCTSK
eukprot:gene20245-24273_t